MTTPELHRLATAGPRRVLWRHGERLLLGRDDGGLTLLDPRTGAEQVIAGRLPGVSPVIGRHSRMGARLTRSAPRAALPLADGGWLWVAAGRLWRMSGDANPDMVTRFPAGHGPLFLTATPDGVLWWGDYVATRRTVPIRLYRSDDQGRTWRAAYEFSRGAIRHVHGVFWDPWTRRLWFTSGDYGDQIGLWVLDGEDPRRVLGGESRFRVVQLLFTATHVLFGSDLPGGENALHAYDRVTGKVEQLLPVRGPVFFGTAAGSWLAFSTVVEPTHEGAHAGLYVGSAETLQFQEVLTLRKDRWPSRLFQYGQIFLPQNAAPNPVLWVTPLATSFDGCLLCVAPEGLVHPTAGSPLQPLTVVQHP